MSKKKKSTNSESESKDNKTDKDVLIAWIGTVGPILAALIGLISLVWATNIPIRNSKKETQTAISFTQTVETISTLDALTLTATFVTATPEFTLTPTYTATSTETALPTLSLCKNIPDLIFLELTFVDGDAERFPIGNNEIVINKTDIEGLQNLSGKIILDQGQTCNCIWQITQNNIIATYKSPMNNCSFNVSLVNQVTRIFFILTIEGNPPKPFTITIQEEVSH